MAAGECTKQKKKERKKKNYQIAYKKNWPVAYIKYKVTNNEQ